MPSEFVIGVGLSELQLLEGDITRIAADAIVNAANSELAGGGGVDGAIHAAGGEEIMRELREIRARVGRCATGSAVVTKAGRLPARYVFHAVGPVYRGGNNGEPEQLASCYRTGLDLAMQLDLKTVSFPSISTGIYGYPIAAAAEIAITTVTKWLNGHPNSVSTVKLVQFSAGDHAVYRQQAERLRSGLSLGTASK